MARSGRSPDALAAQQAMTMAPAALRYGDCATSKGAQTAAASAVAPTADGIGLSRVSVPASVTISTAPIESRSPEPPLISACPDTEARMTATAAAMVIRKFTLLA